MSKELVGLGIESSAYVFGIGIVTETGKILADERAVYRPEAGKGLIPSVAQKFHLTNSTVVLKRSLEKANLTLQDIEVISYAAGPGIPLCLMVGANLATKLAKKYNKSLVPVHHGLGHILIAKLMTGAKDAIVVYLSGGHTAIMGYVEGYFKIMGETQNITLGNVFDMFARELGLPMPGGPEIEKLSSRGHYIELPYSVKGCDLSYSGTLTAAINLLRKGIPKEDIAYSLQETCFAMLVEVTERAIAHTGKNEVLLVGGVAANKRLQEMMNQMCEERGAKFFVVPKEYAQDNGAQIAWAGILAYKSGWKDLYILKNKINSKWRIDDVEITWIENKTES